MSVEAGLPAFPGPGGYVRPTWRQAAAEYLPARWRGPAADRWIGRVPVLAVLAVAAALSLRLHNTAFVDEARAIDVGHEQLAHHPEGLPALYPVLAGALDDLGGLRLVRLFSLACVLATTVVLTSAARRVSGSYRLGLLTGCAFTFTAPTVYVGALATPDAACLLLLAVAARVGVAGRPPAVAGFALALAASVLTAPLLSAGGGVTAFPWRQGPVSPQAPGTLVGWTVLSLAGLIALAVAGAVYAVRELEPRRWSGILALLVVGTALPLAQAWSGEGHRFHETSAYAALFLAPPAGLALTALSRGLFRMVPVAVILLVALVPAASRSASVHAGWADVTPVLQDIDAHPRPGRYLSPASDTLAYHTRDDHPEISWDAAATLYGRGDAAIREAVAHRIYQVVYVRSVSTAGPGQDVLLSALALSPDYEPEAFATDAGAGDHWSAYRLVNTLP